MDQDLLTQITNGPDVDLDMGGDLQHADPTIVGHPEPSARVSGVGDIRQVPC